MSLDKLVMVEINWGHSWSIWEVQMGPKVRQFCAWYIPKERSCNTHFLVMLSFSHFASVVFFSSVAPIHKSSIPFFGLWRYFFGLFLTETKATVKHSVVPKICLLESISNWETMQKSRIESYYDFFSNFYDCMKETSYEWLFVHYRIRVFVLVFSV